MKYFIFDLDDTLLNNNKEVTDYTLKGINILKNNDFLIVINTARSFSATLDVANIIKPDYLICNAGAVIYDKDYNLIFKKTISIQDTNEIIDLIKTSNDVKNFSIQTIKTLYTKDFKYTQNNPIATYNDFINKLDEESVKILIASYDHKKWESVALKYNYEIERYFNGIWCRISPSNKYLGNLSLFKLLNDNNPLDYVFGDDSGDILMIKNAYKGVLMKNSKLTNLDLNISSYTNEEDGVIKFMLEKVI
jgi:hydroxymethylpyrimidine pyrophosphatase-like HAD family hydrolase